MYLKKLFPLLLASAVLTGCGGGGSSSSSNNNATSTTTASGAYTGKRDTAQLTSTNQFAFVALLIDAATTAEEVVSEADTLTGLARNSQVGGVFASQVSDKTEASLQFQPKILELAMKKFEQNRYQAKTYNESAECDYGGTATVTGDVNDSNYTGSLNFTFDQCKMSSDSVLSGSGTLLVTSTDVAAQTFTDFTLTFNGVSVTVGSTVYKETGTKRVIRTLASNTDQVISNWHSLNQSTGWQSWENGVKTNFSPSGMTISGSLCEGTYGCVSLATTTPLTLNAAGTAAAGGDMLITGASSKVRLHVVNGVIVVDLDTNGDGTYEMSTPLSQAY